MDLTMSILDGESVLAAFADPAFAMLEEQPQFGAFGRDYYPRVHGAGYQDLSFAVIWKDKPVLLLPCSLIDSVLGVYGLPMRLFVRDGLDPQVERAAIKTAFAQFDTLASRHAITSMMLRVRGGALLDPVGEAALARDARADVSLIASVDLTAGPEAWKRALRKRFQQFVNWGRKTYAIRYVNGSNCTDADFEDYRAFHARVAGRVTRSKDSWDAMQRAVAAGRGELILGTIDGALVAGSLFIDGTVSSIYMTGVYDRDLDKPLAHYMMWHGIERAAGRGLKRLEIGDVSQKGTVDEKYFAIGYFKRGFATDIEQWTDWRWSPKPRGE